MRLLTAFYFVLELKQSEKDKMMKKKLWYPYIQQANKALKERRGVSIC